MTTPARAPFNLAEYLAAAHRRFARAVTRSCRVCGCTDTRACEGGCWWVEDDLCNRCRKEDAA